MRIAVVDSSRVVLKIISDMLKPRGYSVSCFLNSREALGFVQDNEDVGVLITSLEVQPIGGIELCWSARLLARADRPIYILVMSSQRQARIISEALDSGADDFISKPPAAEEFYARLRAAERLATMQRELIRLADTDSLTGLYNRRAFTTRLQQAIENRAHGRRAAFVMFDVDHFKSINDEHGHDVGDTVLQAIARAAAEEGVFAGRLGGEEFGLVFIEDTHQRAIERTEELRLHMAALEIAIPGGLMRTTCSFGVAEWADGDTVSDLMKRADIALYRAKRAGRNRVMFQGRVETIIPLSPGAPQYH